MFEQTHASATKRGAGFLSRQVGAYLDVVLFEDEKWVSVLALQSAAPRTWSASEEGVFREVGERVKAAIERLRAEDRLRDLNDTLERRVTEAMAERNMLAKLVEMTDVMIMAIDLDFNILALNAANAGEFERIYGVRPKAGDNMLALLADQPKHREQVRIGWEQGMRGEPVTFVEDYGDPDRARPYYEVNFRPLRNEAGEQIGVYQFVTDVTRPPSSRGAARRGARGASPVAEDGGDGPAHRRRRARLQQPAYAHRRLARHAAAQAARRRARAAPDRRRDAIGRAREDARRSGCSRLRGVSRCSP